LFGVFPSCSGKKDRWAVEELRTQGKGEGEMWMLDCFGAVCAYGGRPFITGR